MHGRAPAPGVGVVHDVVVDEREGVEHLHRERRREGVVKCRTRRLRREQHEERTDPLAAAFEGVARGCVEFVGRQRGHDRPQARFYTRLHRLQRGALGPDHALGLGHAAMRCGAASRKTSSTRA